MLTRLRFKNWRSLRDVTIDNLTPLTVFIGANSSGKTNIVDAMSFLRRMFRENTPEAIYFQGERENIRTLGIDDNEPLELELSSQPDKTDYRLTYALIMQPEGKIIHFSEQLKDDSTGKIAFQATDGAGGLYLQGTKFIGLSNRFTPPSLAFPMLRTFLNQSADEALFTDFLPHIQMSVYCSHHWQLLRENFMPPSSLPLSEEHDAYMIDRDARNVAFMLDFMQKVAPEVTGELRADLTWLLDHVENLKIVADDRETRITINENVLQGQTAPTISGGTARIIAMLTAYYALDLQLAEMPGLLVIEEPDMAVHPALLRRLVELFREYVSREGHPRQIILTTHNPQLLNWFEPEEVRVVERDENGDTHINLIPPSIKEIWLDGGKYGLGDVWMTRSLGGVPE